ncbi:MAG TPA: hypothetical protein VMV75_03860 [Sulfuricella sp.]|nr:hypothetical protein [Sulfuricella sp.]
MNTLKQLKKQLLNAKHQKDSEVFWRLVRALCLQEDFRLAELYELSYDDFQFALDVIKSWRLDRYTKTRERIRELVDAQQE